MPADIEGVYRAYLEQFDRLKASLEKIVEKRGELESELRKGLERWKSMMNSYLEEINTEFNKILSRIGGRGRVELVGQDPRTMGLDIKVGFEGKEMTSIGTLSQSGGEKSLSTMAFLLAVQRQIRSPFRAVDEYDVHLDPVNRSRVTSLLRSAVEGSTERQYIAITPSGVSEEDLRGVPSVIVVQSTPSGSRVGTVVLEG